MESRWSYVRQLNSQALPTTTSSAERPYRNTEKLTLRFDSYNRYLAIAARVVRRSLKEDKRIAAERRGEMDLRFSKWQVRRYGTEKAARGKKSDAD